VHWRLIDDPPHNAFYNMALDEAISEAVRRKLSLPTLRLYEWIEPSISIGYFQRISDINIDYCRRSGYQVVRRQTGGMALLHNSELTYSLSACNDLEPFKGNLIKNYLTISNTIVSALKLINLNAQIISSKNRRQRNPYCFRISSYGEITLNGEKIIGSAQKRYKDGFLQQGSILMDSDAGELSKVLRMGGFSCEVGTIKKYAPSVSIEDLKKALKEAFEKTLTIEFIHDGPTEFELNLARKLETEKYSADEWNFKHR